MVRNASYLSSKEIWQYITDLKFCKVPLTVEEIETILDVLVYDGKIEKTMERETGSGQVKTYRAVSKPIASAGFVRIPCGVCPVRKNLKWWTHLLTVFNASVFIVKGDQIVCNGRISATQELLLLRPVGGLMKFSITKLWFGMSTLEYQEINERPNYISSISSSNSSGKSPIVTWAGLTNAPYFGGQVK